MPFTPENTEQKTKTHTIQKLNTTQIKQIMQNTAKQNYPGLVAFYDTRPGKEVGLFSLEPANGHGKVELSVCLGWVPIHSHFLLSPLH